ncbi:MAG: D-glycerate dehydrogenase [Acidobacteriota bacterium]
MKPKVYLTHPLLPAAMDFLEKHVDKTVGPADGPAGREELIRGVRDCEGLLSLLTVTVDATVMDAAPCLRIIANCAVGYNNIDIDAARERGILVTNTPGVLTDTTADLTWALIMAVARLIPQADRFTRERRFKGWALDLFLGREITGQILGIVGMGRIGKAVAERAKGFQMKVLYHDPHRLSPEVEKTLNASWRPLDDVVREADVLTLHTTLSPETKHLLNAKRLAKMKRTAIVINVSRGPIVDEKALADALTDGRIWGAGLDVYEREPVIEKGLLSLDNVILLPHMGSATEATRLKMSMMAAENLIAGLSGRTPPNLI